MTQQEIQNIINKHVGYAEQEIYDALDAYTTQITTDVAVKFGKFLLWYTPVGDDYGNLILWKNVHTQEVKLTEQLFEEFINNYYEK